MDQHKLMSEEEAVALVEWYTRPSLIERIAPFLGTIMIIAIGIFIGIKLLSLIG